MNAFWTHLSVIAFLFTALVAKAEVEVPDDLRFVIADPHHMAPDERSAWFRSLHDTPNIGGRLCDLLWAFYREESNEGIAWIMGALMARDDIPPAQLKKITDEMRRLAGMNTSDVQKLGVLNMLYGVRILERYPSSEHEELALLLLNSEDSVIRSNAVTTLGRIGTERSVEPMKKHYDPFRYIKTDPPHEGPQVFEAEQMLHARIANKTGASISGPTKDHSKRPQATTKAVEPKQVTLDEGQTSSTPWSVIVILILILIVAATGLLWLLLKRRS